MKELGQPGKYKTCDRCKSLLYESDFGPNTLTHDGRSCWCKQCWEAYPDRSRRRSVSNPVEAWVR